MIFLVEEELKRLHAAGYGQVGFNYDAPRAPEPPPPAELDEPFVPTSAFKALFSPNIVMVGLGAALAHYVIDALAPLCVKM